MNKKIVCALIALTLVFGLNTPASAKECPQMNQAVKTTVIIVSPRMDEIVTKYRFFNGKAQYRRWNQTKGVWVDPAWIDL